MKHTVASVFRGRVLKLRNQHSRRKKLNSVNDLPIELAEVLFISG